MSATSEVSPNGSTGTAGDSAADVVRRFLQALVERDIDTAVDLVADDLAYENVSLPTIRTRHRFDRMARRFFAGSMRFDVRIHRIATDGPTVLTERTDALMMGGYRTQFWVCGTFEVVDGKITLWRDYFDWGAILASMGRGLLGLVVPSLRPRFADER